MSVRISSMVWAACPLDGDRLLLMLALADFCDDEAVCWPSQRTLAERTRCSLRGVQKMMDALIEQGEVKIIQPGGGRGRSARYGLPKYLKGEQAVHPLAPAERANVETRKGERQRIKGERGDVKGEQAVSQNHQEPSMEPSIEPPRAAMPPELQDVSFQEAWAKWNEYRKQAKLRAYTPIGAQQQLKNLSKWGSARAVAAIEHSIGNGYQGIFEPKQNGTGKPPRQSEAQRDQERTGLPKQDFKLKTL